MDQDSKKENGTFKKLDNYRGIFLVHILSISLRNSLKIEYLILSNKIFQSFRMEV